MLEDLKRKLEEAEVAKKISELTGESVGSIQGFKQDLNK